MLCPFFITDFLMGDGRCYLLFIEKNKVCEKYLVPYFHWFVA